MIEFLDGNEASVRGAIDAGCNFFAGYPITPATSILIEMMRELPAKGNISIQAEDEIASLGFCIAASMAGKKAMTATSGPGISLYSENIGLAIMGETPLVIVDVQRQGPATGSATKDGAADIQFVRWGTSGGYPIIAIAPTTPAECYTYIMYAFNLAEIFRTPTFIMSSKEVALTREPVDWNKVEKPKIVDRKLFGSNGIYIPYNFNKVDEIPEFAAYGSKHLIRFTTSTHDKYGNLLSDPIKIQEMMDHLNKKIDEDKITTHFPHSVKIDSDCSDTMIIAYGITARSAIEAVKIARSKGTGVSLMTIALLWPCPEKLISKYLAGVNKIIIPEMNNGHYAQEIERITCGKKIIKINQINTQIISPKKILDVLENN